MKKVFEAFVRLEHSSKRYKGRKEDLDIIFTFLKNYEELINRSVMFCRSTRQSKQALIDMICKNHKEVKITCLEDENKSTAFDIIKSKIIDFSFKYGGKLGNVIQLQIGLDTCYLHFDENDKNFDLLRDMLYENK